mgnify:CR=1 FL=1
MSHTHSPGALWCSRGAVGTGLFALRAAIGWHLLYEGLSKLLSSGWTSAAYLSTAEWVLGGLFRGLASAPWLLAVTDAVNMWTLAAAGLCLMVGALTRPAAIAGILLLLLYSAAHPALPGMAGATAGGSYLIVDRNIVEALALAVIAVLPFGSLWGLDRLIARRRALRSAAPAASTGITAPSPAGRRELLKDLAGAPVVGTLAAMILRVRAARHEEPDAVSGATSLIPVTPGLGPAGNIVSVRDFERLAPRYMSQASWAYVSGGAGDEQTLRWSEGAFRQVLLRQQVMTTRAKPDTRIRLLDRERPHPILLAPAGSQVNLHPDGEVASARGAGAAGAIMILSTVTQKSIETVAAAATAPLWYQAYLYKDRGRSLDNLKRAEAAGFEALCVTVDSSSNGPRDREYRYRRQHKPEIFLKHRPEPWTWLTTWDDVEWYRAHTKLPLIPKGVMTADDAERSIQLGAAAVYISNHGGRTFDSGVVPIQILPVIVERVAGRVPILIDGGIRRGTDVLKALALGAAAVAIGRPYLYGLAVKGPDGVAAVVNMLWNELEMAMVSTGQTTLTGLDRSAILAAPKYPDGIA